MIVNVILKVVFRMSFDVETQKLDGNMLDIYRMIVTSFLLTNKAN